VEELHADVDHESRRHNPSNHDRRASADRRHHPTASLGAVVAKGHCDLRRDRQRADRKDLVGLAPRRQDAFTDLLLTVCVALRNYRTIRIAYVTNLQRSRPQGSLRVHRCRHRSPAARSRRGRIGRARRQSCCEESASTGSAVITGAPSASTRAGLPPEERLAELDGFLKLPCRWPGG
jgi:hypothetical protein